MNKAIIGEKASSWFVLAAQALCLSWIFALCAQLYVPLPFNIVPVYLHPLPLLLAVLWYRKVAVMAYVFYLIQGGLGLPFFARMNGGLLYMMGPTGGYLFGFLLTMIFFDFFISLKIEADWIRLGVLLLGALIYFLSALVHLAHFVSIESLLALGFFPFLCGDLIKLLIVWRVWR